MDLWLNLPKPLAIYKDEGSGKEAQINFTHI